LHQDQDSQWSFRDCRPCTKLDYHQCKKALLEQVQGLGPDSVQEPVQALNLEQEPVQAQGLGPDSEQALNLA
jgi:hypothetical protein